MAGTPRQKQKILMLLRILSEETDRDHAMTLEELSAALLRVGLECERKALYRDLAALSDAGFTVKTVRSRDVRYYFDGSPLTRRDRMLLANLLRISPAVPRKRKPELEKKLRALTPFPQQRECFADVLSVLPEGSVTERVYSNVEVLYDGILSGRKVRFLYKGTALRDLSLRRKRTVTYPVVSPYRLVWNDGYFLVGADASGELMFYRVDRMEDLSVTDQEAIDIREIGGDLDFDLNQYVKGVFSSLEDPVPMIFRVSGGFLAEAERRFPSDSIIESAGGGEYLLSCEIPADETLFGWLLLHPEDLRLVYPEGLVQRLRAVVAASYTAYPPEDTAE